MLYDGLFPARVWLLHAEGAWWAVARFRYRWAIDSTTAREIQRQGATRLAGISTYPDRATVARLWPRHPDAPKDRLP